MNANDARLVRLITVESGGLVEDSTPNVQAGNPAQTFDLILQAEAGRQVGGTQAPYNLLVTALDLTAGSPAPAQLVPNVPANLLSFSNPPWVPSPAANANNFLFNERFRIPTAGNLPGGLANHVFQYTAVLVTRDFNIVSLIQSNLFLLV
jgi:hypothetical protein